MISIKSSSHAKHPTLEKHILNKWLIFRYLKSERIDIGSEDFPLSARLQVYELKPARHLGTQMLCRTATYKNLYINICTLISEDLHPLFYFWIQTYYSRPINFLYSSIWFDLPMSPLHNDELLCIIPIVSFLAPLPNSHRLQIFWSDRQRRVWPPLWRILCQNYWKSEHSEPQHLFWLH